MKSAAKPRFSGRHTGCTEDSMATPNQSPFRDDQTYQINGAGFEVHSQIGGGFPESVYAEAFAIELGLRKIPFAREVRLPIHYKGQLLPVHYRVDFICFGEVLVELKAQAALGPVDRGQVLNYLRASKKERALLLNFGPESLEHKRVVLDLADDPVRHD